MVYIFAAPCRSSCPPPPPPSPPPPSLTSSVAPSFEQVVSSCAHEVRSLAPLVLPFALACPPNPFVRYPPGYVSVAPYRSCKCARVIAVPVAAALPRPGSASLLVVPSRPTSIVSPDVRLAKQCCGPGLTSCRTVKAILCSSFFSHHLAKYRPTT